MNDIKDEIRKIIKDGGIKSNVSFIGVDWPYISYIITYKNGNNKFKMPYYMGIGHVDWLKTPRNLTNDDCAVINTMRRNPYVTLKDTAQLISTATKLAKFQGIKPDADEALAIICRDVKEAIETTFEEWAMSLGYDTDSREAERIYIKLIGQYHRLLAIIGRDSIDRLSELSSYL